MTTRLDVFQVLDDSQLRYAGFPVPASVGAAFVASVCASSQQEVPEFSIIGMSGLSESKLCGGEFLAIDVEALSSGS